MTSMTLFAVRQPLRPDPDNVADLWAYYAQTRDQATREKLLAAYGEFSRMLAAKVYARRILNEMDFDDYLQYATIGLIEAIDRFDPALGIKFETFASSRINGAMLNGIETCSEMQQQIHARKHMLGQRVASLVEGPPKPASADNVFARLAEIAVGLAVGFALEESKMYTPDNAHYADNSYTALEMRQLQARVRKAVTDLPANQRHVIKAHYLQGIPFEEIAAGMSLTRGRVSQLHKQALAGLCGLLKNADELDMRF